MCYRSFAEDGINNRRIKIVDIVKSNVKTVEIVSSCNDS